MPYKDPIVAKAKARERTARYRERHAERVLRERKEKWAAMTAEDKAAHAARMAAYRKTEKFIQKRAAKRDIIRQKRLAWYHSPEARDSKERAKQRSRELKLAWCRKFWEANREFWLEFQSFRRNPSRRQAIKLKWNRCGGKCYICGSFVAWEAVNIDHVVPRSLGGQNDIWNLMPVHQKCNILKSDDLKYPVVRPDFVLKTLDIKAVPRNIRNRRKVPNAKEIISVAIIAHRA